MAKQFHYVVMFDTETKEWGIEWDTTDVMLEQNQGTIFDTKTSEWETCGTDEVLEEDYRDSSDVLADLLSEYNRLKKEGE